MGKLIYITGLSGAGKTTISEELQKHIPNSIFLDGDIIRDSINKDLGFDRNDKLENIRRNNELIHILYNQGFTIIAAFMASIIEERDKVFTICPNSYLIQLTTPLSVCIERDPKGLYIRKLDNFSGTTFKYEMSTTADLHIDTSKYTVDECVETILTAINKV